MLPQAKKQTRNKSESQLTVTTYCDPPCSAERVSNMADCTASDGEAWGQNAGHS
jgi:hypothetical protein